MSASRMRQIWERLSASFFAVRVDRERRQGSAGERALLIGLLAAFFITLIRTAWMCDDAYITFRTVDNFLNGYGLRWNVTERVQSFTHPLWLMLHVAAVGLTGNVYHTSLFLSMSLSTLAVAIVAFGVASDTSTATLAVLSISFSKAFVEYSTSGLENPLSYFLVSIFLWIFLRWEVSSRTFLFCCLSASLLMLNRQDMILLLFPMLALQFWQVRSVKAFVLGLVSLTPWLAWEVFAVMYYGFPYPNTAYAKLATAIPKDEVYLQGMMYCLDLCGSDPLTASAIVGAVVAGVCSRSAKAVAATIGIGLYVLYVIRIGGDFMAGRFFSVPFLIGVGVFLSIVRRLPPRATLVAAGLIVVLGLVPAGNSYLAGADYPMMAGRTDWDASNLRTTMVCDERAYYYKYTGLLQTSRFRDTMAHSPEAVRAAEDRDKPDRVFVSNTVGVYGYYIGPTKYVIDPMGLCNVFTARLPTRGEYDWRPGHYYRLGPEGYWQTVVGDGKNVIADPGVAEYYDKLMLIVQGPIWSKARWKAIWAMNRGQYQPLLANYRGWDKSQRSNHWKLPLIEKSLTELSQPLPEQSAWDAPGSVVMGDKGISIRLGALHHEEEWIAALDSDDDYEFEFLQAGRKLASTYSPYRPVSWAGIEHRRVPVPKTAADKGYDQILVRPIYGNNDFSIAGLTPVATLAFPGGLGVDPDGGDNAPAK